MPVMAALIALGLAWAALPAPGLNRTDPVRRWVRFIHEAADRSALPEAWIADVIRAESAGRTMLGGRPITSRAGAMGLMQLMPATWTAMRARLGLGSDPFDPHDNIVAGAAFLRLMYDRFGYPGLFAAYNAGPARYSAHLAGAKLPAETMLYLRKMAAAESRSIGPPTAPPPSLVMPIRTGGSVPAAAPASGGALFAIRHDESGAEAEDNASTLRE